ncbi:MAG: HNH endonuclease [Bacteroidia bacterium]|nr:HNH endonuclease [Bacteroidia bacterium]
MIWGEWLLNYRILQVTDAKQGPNQVSNGLLLRSDIHKLFDKGIMTITKDHRVEISNDIRSEYENSSKYLILHGKTLENLPKNPKEHPHEKYLIWHNDNCFRR